MNKNGGIEKKLTRSFFQVASIAAGAALFGLIVMLILSWRYSYALTNFGFAQGDIGTAMFEFADIRSSLRATIGYDNQEAIDEVVQQHTDMIAAFERSFAKIEDTIVSEDGRANYDQIEQDLKTYWELDDKIMRLGATTDREYCKLAQEMALTQLAPVYSSIYDKLEGLLDVKVSEGNKLSKTLTIACVMVGIIIVLLIGGSMYLSTRIGKRISVRITSPLKQLGNRLKTFSEGDLTSPFPAIKSGDEIEEMTADAMIMADHLNVIIHDIGEVLGEMADGNYAVKSKASKRYTGDFKKLYESMRGMRDQMKETLLSIGESSSHVSCGSGDLAKASQSLAEGATEQAGAVEELHATISDITVTMEKSAQSAEESYSKAQHYADAADSSREEMHRMMEAMGRINEASARIGDIISKIESIAAQTNLLSLNASIEAARAGDSGRGFSVVADQIRELANQSAKAAVDTRELIEGSIKEVAEGNSSAERAAHAIESVVDGIKQIAEFSRNLKNMVEDQTEAVRQAEVGVDQISEVVQVNAATAQQASATSEELSAQATILDELVGRFVLTKE
jgi:methyl-accepting chemotaxis protein